MYIVIRTENDVKNERLESKKSHEPPFRWFNWRVLSNMKITMMKLLTVLLVNL